MANAAQAVWGIEIGQAGLKAIRLRYAEAARQVIAVAFDYIPHPKLLNQPDAVPDELVSQALDTFLSRNEVQGDLIAVGLPGATALTRFIQLPPVESSKVAEIVRYEARQQIPFALEDVIWDYQTLGGGVEESGYMLGAEVGLFAMKRDQVEKQLAPFLEKKIEVELLQLAPLALYNCIAFDQLGIRPGEEFTPSDEYIITLDMGTDNTTLVVTNGEKIWVRNIPIGGNHFTRALTKSMKLTFAKAEHLKCNATRSPDPRAVFQALRPVFNDYVAEIQRSIGYFSSVNREAKIARVIGVGNGFKLAGLQKFLQQNLQHEVIRIDTFPSLVGDVVLNAPLFQENVLTFPVPYGLALQALGLTRIHTSLLPPEIVLQRKIRRKKPWAVATAASLLFGLATSAAGYSLVADSVSEARFGDAERQAASFQSEVSRLKSEYDQATATNTQLKEKLQKYFPGLEEREYWLELYRAINECLPRDSAINAAETDIRKKNRLNLIAVNVRKYADLKTWFEGLAPGPKRYMRPDDKGTPPEGPGYVVTLYGEHMHDDQSDPNGQGVLYVASTLIKNLNQFVLRQPGTQEPVPVRQIGISHATIVDYNAQQKVPWYPNGPKSPLRPNSAASRFGLSGATSPLGLSPGAGSSPALGSSPRFSDPGAIVTAPEEGFTETPGFSGTTSGDAAPGQGEYIMVPKTLFWVEFAWRPVPKSERPLQDPLAAAQVAPGVQTQPGSTTGAAGPTAPTTGTSGTAAAGSAPVTPPPATSPAGAGAPPSGAAPTGSLPQK